MNPTAPAPANLDALVAERLAGVRDRIAAAGRDPSGVTIVAVTKGQPPAAVLAARRAGLLDLGESHADELVAKAAATETLAGGGRWHFLGSIQRNKLARLAPVVACYEGVDRVEEAEAIGRRAPGAAVLVEVDTTGAPGRGGVPPGEVAELCRQIARLPVDLRGLMTVAPEGDEAATRRTFALVAALRSELGLPECSMGMSGDFPLAVAAGATLVRLGTVLFGPRE